MKFEQMEFDFSYPKEQEPVRRYRIEITLGFDGDETEVKTERTGTFSDACRVVAEYGKIFKGYHDIWTYTKINDNVTVVDFGSYCRFGRITNV